MFRGILSFALVAGFAGLTAGQDKLVPSSSGRQDQKDEGKPKAEPEGTPLELAVTGKTTKYTLDTGGMNAADYKKSIEDAAKAKGKVKLPASPVVDLAVEIKNTSDKAVKVWAKGDPVVLTMTLKGKGAVNADSFGPMTLEFRIPEAVEIAAGKTHSIPVKSLTSGMRGVTKYAYWTEPGEYELVATLRTGMNPAPKGAKEGMDGFGVVTLTSAPLKVTVEAKK